jgi:hypothetical protein
VYLPLRERERDVPAMRVCESEISIPRERIRSFSDGFETLCSTVSAMAFPSRLRANEQGAKDRE